MLFLLDLIKQTNKTKQAKKKIIYLSDYRHNSIYIIGVEEFIFKQKRKK